MRFEWDEQKRQSNLAKHGIDFADLASVFAGDTVTVTDDRFDYQERRFITIGLLTESSSQWPTLRRMTLSD